MHFPQDAVHAPLHVVTCIFNPERFKSRAKLYRDWQLRMRQAGAVVTTVVASVGERDNEVRAHAGSRQNATSEDTQHRSSGPATVPLSAGHRDEHIEFRVGDWQQIWIKENLLNLGVQRLPADWKYVAFIDADTAFARPDWVSETLHQLQRFHVVQMWETAIDLGPTGNPLQMHKSFAWCHAHGRPRPPRGYYYGDADDGTIFWHPGFAWAWRREAFNAVSGLLETGLLGAGDHHMAGALLGCGIEGSHPNMHAGYRRSIARWQTRALEAIKTNIGHVAGTILHYWHGRKADRRYWDRWRILVSHKYNPESDLERDWQGVLRLTSRKPALRDACRAYFAQRNEDSIDE